MTRIRRDASVEQDEESSVSEYSEISASDSGEDEEESQTRPRKRARGSTVSSDQCSSILSTSPASLLIPSVATSKQPKYTILKTEPRQVEAQVIKNKWRPTTAAAQAKVKTILSLVERPVINSNRDLERRKEAQTSLAALSRM